MKLNVAESWMNEWIVKKKRLEMNYTTYVCIVHEDEL